MKHSELRHQPRHVNPRIQDILKKTKRLIMRIMKKQSTVKWKK